MKKFCSLLLVICMLLSLSACGDGEPVQNNGGGNYCVECGGKIAPTDKFCSSCGIAIEKPDGTEATNDTASDPTENDNGGANDTTTPESTITPTTGESGTANSTTTAPTTSATVPTNPNPTTTNPETTPSTAPHTHAFEAATCTEAKKCACGETEGKALGHKWAKATCTTAKTCSICKKTEGTAAGHQWAKATCTTAKTCSVCKKTEGAAAGHKWKDATCEVPATCSVCKTTKGTKLDHIIQGTVCKMCNKVVAVNPKNFSVETDYACAGYAGPHVSEYDGKTYHLYTLTYLEKDNFCASVGGYVKSGPYEDWPCIDGIYYGPTGEWNCQVPGLCEEWAYEVVGDFVIITATVDFVSANKATLKCQLLSDGSLKVVAISGYPIPSITGIKVGIIFYPMDT